MNAQELQEVLSQRLDLSLEEIDKMLQNFAKEVKQELTVSHSVCFSDFGQWKICSKASKVQKDISSQKCYLLPPQYVIAFEVSSSYKLWIQNLTRS